MKIIAYMRCDFKEKFGIPRQSGIAETRGVIVFEPEYSVAEAFRGIEEYSHLWILWQFSEAVREDWSPTVRPPRLGGNKRMGVFATRSPNLPNSIGLSSVKLIGLSSYEGRIALEVEGADLLDGTPIYDVKPYLSYTDSHPEAKCGFADRVRDYSVEVEFSPEVTELLSEGERLQLCEILKEDPRPSYIDDGDRIYTFTYGERQISFFVKDSKLVVCGVSSD